MSNINKQAQYESKFSRLWERYDEASHGNAEQMRDILEVTLDALESAERQILRLEKLAEALEARDKQIAEMQKPASKPVAQIEVVSGVLVRERWMHSSLTDGWHDLFSAPKPESRTVTVKLPERYSCELGYNSPNPKGDMLDRDDVLAMLAAAGIGVKG